MTFKLLTDLILYPIPKNFEEEDKLNKGKQNFVYTSITRVDFWIPYKNALFLKNIFLLVNQQKY